MLELVLVTDLVSQLFLDNDGCIVVQLHKGSGAITADLVLHEKLGGSFNLVAADDKQQLICTHDISHTHGQSVAGNIITACEEKSFSLGSLKPR